VRITNFVHKGLKRLYLEDSAKGLWSLHVTRNWRLTFQIEDGVIFDVDYEDYH
jgi:proteic killer suppression protein